MKNIKRLFPALATLFLSTMATAQDYDGRQALRHQVPLSDIIMSDPFVLADSASQTYYMTGTGGMMWTSKDLALWDGPYMPFRVDSTSWMGPRPHVWAAELHHYKDKYYYFATFTNPAVMIDTVAGRAIERRACHVLTADSPQGPYTPQGDATYLPANKPTLDATLWEEDGTPYMIYCHEWLQNLNGTVESIALKPDLSGTTGEAQILFRASDSPWSRENVPGSERPNVVTDGPFLFRTATGRLGMIWTSWVRDVYTQGVAYSVSGRLSGPWQQEEAPITPPDYGHGMLFRTFAGQWLMSVHSHYVDDRGRYIRRPHFFHVDLSGDKLVVGKEKE